MPKQFWQVLAFRQVSAILAGFGVLVFWRFGSFGTM
jgi:hypothetical protein